MEKENWLYFFDLRDTEMSWSLENTTESISENDDGLISKVELKAHSSKYEILTLAINKQYLFESISVNTVTCPTQSCTSLQDIRYWK